MKRKHAESDDSGDDGAAAAVAAVAAFEQAERDAKKAKSAEEVNKATSGDGTKRVIELDETIDVEAFFKQDCDVAAQKLLEQTKARCADLRREFEQSKQAILSGLAAEKENLLHDREAAASTPDAFDVSIKVVAGPYKGSSFLLHLDAKRKSCLIGRSTGRKFRAPNGLSMPKDAELSTTHAQALNSLSLAVLSFLLHLQLRLEADGRMFFTDLDSTNGSFINDESVEPHEPHLLSTTTPNKVYVGGSDLLVSFTRRS